MNQVAVLRMTTHYLQQEKVHLNNFDYHKELMAPFMLTPKTDKLSFMFVGILITGGTERGTGTEGSAEVFIPETGETCSFPDLPNDRKYHSINTLDNNTVVICGGGDTM